MSYNLVCLLALFLGSLESQATVVYVDNKRGADTTLCVAGGNHTCRSLVYALNHTKSNVTIALLSHVVALNDGIELIHRSNVSIVGQGRDRTIIQCTWETGTLNETSLGVGISVYLVWNFTISNLTMNNCGTLQRLRNGSLNRKIIFRSSLFIYYSSYITIDGIAINSSNGMGVAVFNANNSMKIYNSIFFNNTAEEKYQKFAKDFNISGGGGIHFTLFESIAKNSVYIVHNCKFIQNTKHSFGYNFTVYSGAGNGGGLQIRLDNSVSHANISISDCQFTRNSGDWGGSLVIAILKHSYSNHVTIKNTIFESNMAVHGGGGIDIGLYQFHYNKILPKRNKVHIDNCTIRNNSAMYGGGNTVFSVSDLHYARLHNKVIFENCHWISNTAEFSAAVDISPDTHDNVAGGISLVPRFTNCTFINNSIIAISFSKQHNPKHTSRNFSFYFSSGVFLATSINIDFHGETIFQNNNGTALQLTSALARFWKGSNVTFSENIGNKGGAIALVGMSYLQFEPNSTFHFVNNRAKDVGGAIFSYSIDQHDYIVARTCIFKYNYQYYGFPAETAKRNVTFLFSGNYAQSKLGHSIFATTLLPCKSSCTHETKGTPYRNETQKLIYLLNHCVANFTFNDQSKHSLATLGYRYGYPINDTIFTAMPGGILQLHPTIRDELDNNVSSNTVFKINVPEDSAIETNKNFQYTTTGNVQIMGEPGLKGGIILKTDDLLGVSIYVNITLGNCPPGYIYQHEKNQCKCNARNYEGFQSCANPFRVYILSGYWTGYLPGETPSPKTLVSAVCPLGYCAYNKSISTSPRLLLPRYASSQTLNKFICSEGRKGVLCGECSDNHSVYYHSSNNECIEDNEICKLGIVFFILSDLIPATVMFFIVLFFNISFTSGEMNGFVTFAQVIGLMNTNANGLIPFPTARYLILGTELIYGFFNLHINSDEISFCIWKGAKTLDILAIRYITIIYALLLVLVLVFIMNHCGCYRICRCIHRQSFGSSIIQGLSAFLIMCYAQCAQVTFMILQPARLKGEGLKILYNYTVLHYSGNLPYFGSKHLPYALIALVFGLALVILPPAILLANAVFVKVLPYCHCRNPRITNIILMTRFKPLFDSFQGCFRDSCRCFAGIYFLYRIGILLLHAVSINTMNFYIFLELSLIMLIAVHAIVQPYEKQWHNNLDILLLANLALINGLSIYLYTSQTANNRDNMDATTVYQWIQLLLVYLPIFYITSRVIILSGRKLKRSYTCTCYKREEIYESTEFDDSELPARLLSNQFDKYHSYESTNN